MKKTAGLLATGLMIMIGFENFSNAATKCVALNSSLRCTGSPVGGKVDWTATCNSIPITGVGVCSSTAGSSVGQAADTIATENTTDANRHCWCKMTSPAVSRFVFAGTSADAARCSYGCGGGCLDTAVYNASFRAGLFGNMK